MNSEERFRRSLEELINSKAFPFDEANWDKARGMIDSAKKPRRIAPLILGGILLLGTLVTGAYFLYDTSSATTEQLAVNSNKELQVIAPEVTHTPAQPEAKTPVAFAKQPLSLNPASEKPVTSSQPKNIIPVNVVKQPLLEASVKPVVPDQIAKTTVLDPQKDFVIPTVVNSAPVKSTHSEETTDKPNELVSDVVKNTPPSVPVNTSSQESAENQTPVKMDEPAKDFAGTINPPANTSNTSSDQSAIAIDESSAPAKSDVLNNAPKETATPVALNDSLKSSDLQDLPADNDQGELGKPKDYPVLFSVEAGASYMYGWQNPGARDASGFNPVIGVNYFNNFNPKMSLTFGIQYTSISNLNYSTYTSRVSRFALGEESKVTVYTPVKVHYLVVPLRFNYNLDVLNNIGIGCNIAYLLNVESEVETYTEKLDKKSDQVLSKATGYTEGFKKYDTQVSVFYKRRLYPNLALNLEVYYGLTDIKDNTFFKSNVFERNTGLKLTLVYNFLKK